MCRAEATKLSALADRFKSNGYNLYAVVHEEIGWEEFETNVFPHPVYLDEEKRFYGPNIRREGNAALLAPTVLKRVWKSSSNWGNLKGDGYMLGSVFAITPSRIVYEHREKTFGEEANRTELMEAIEQNKIV